MPEQEGTLPAKALSLAMVSTGETSYEEFAQALEDDPSQFTSGHMSEMVTLAYRLGNTDQDFDEQGNPRYYLINPKTGNKIQITQDIKAKNENGRDVTNAEMVPMFLGMIQQDREAQKGYEKLDELLTKVASGQELSAVEQGIVDKIQGTVGQQLAVVNEGEAPQTLQALPLPEGKNIDVQVEGDTTTFKISKKTRTLIIAALAGLAVLIPAGGFFAYHFGQQSNIETAGGETAGESEQKEGKKKTGEAPKGGEGKKKTGETLKGGEGKKKTGGAADDSEDIFAGVTGVLNGDPNAEKQGVEEPKGEPEVTGTVVTVENETGEKPVEPQKNIEVVTINPEQAKAVRAQYGGTFFNRVGKALLEHDDWTKAGDKITGANNTSYGINGLITGLDIRYSDVTVKGKDWVRIQKAVNNEWVTFDIMRRQSTLNDKVPFQVLIWRGGDVFEEVTKINKATADNK